MLVHEGLKQYLVKEHGLQEDATEAEIIKFTMEKMMSKELTQEDVEKHNVDQKAQVARESLQSMVSEAVEKAMQEVVKSLAPAPEAAPAEAAESHDLREKAETVEPAPESDGAVDTLQIKEGYQVAPGAEIRVKSVVEKYDDTKTGIYYSDSKNEYVSKMYGNTPVMSIGSDFDSPGPAMNYPTERDQAIAKSWLKHLAQRSCNASGAQLPPELRKNEEDHKLIEYAINECKFAGPVDQKSDGSSTYFLEGEKLKDYMYKTVADDVFSGGLEAVPVELDNMVILTPLLNGEIAPHVSVRNVGARRIEGWALGNPTMQWGYGDQDQVPQFDTAGLISGFDNEVHPLTGSIEIGRDFESDSPYAVGSLIMNRFGERFKQEMDNVIVMGNGITQPEGLFFAPGVSVLANQGGPGAVPQIGDYENLYFGIAKEFRNEGKKNFCYISTDASYASSRAIAVNSGTDERRIFGVNDQDDYQLMRRPYRVNESINGGWIMGVCLNRYRLYRRQGLEIVFETGGKTLQTTNKRLMVMRTRWAGALDHAGAAVKILDGKL